MPSREVGRPTVMTPDVIAKLEEAFINGATDLQACFIANISKDALYDYIKANPEFSDRKEQLKDFIKYQAKLNVAGMIMKGGRDGVETAKWYLERRDKDYKPKQDIDMGIKPIPILGGESNVHINDSNQKIIEAEKKD